MVRFRFTRVRLACLGAALALALTGQPAQAYLVFFGEDVNNSETVPLDAFPLASAAEAQFLAFLVGVGTENFEGFEVKQGQPLDLFFPGAGMATLSGSSGEIRQLNKGNADFGRYGVTDNGDPEQYWQVRAGTSTGDFDITFDNGPDGIAAFGFWGVDLGDFGGTLQLSIMTTEGTMEDFLVPHTVGSMASNGGSVVFWGVIAEEGDPGFTMVDFLTTEVDPGFKETFAFDDFTIGSREQIEPPIPEPATALLIGVGLLGLGMSRRRTH